MHHFIISEIVLSYYIIFCQQTSIVIPKRFHEHVGGEINDEVQLQDPVGNTFHLPYYYNNGDHRLGAGFFELRSVHQIETNVVIHFLYHGHGRFNIQIYDTFHNEITYRIAPQVPPQVNPYIGALHDMYVLEVPSDDESDEEVQLEPFEPAPWMEKIWQSNITSAHIHGNHPMVCLICLFVNSYLECYYKLFPYHIYLFFLFLEYFNLCSARLFPSLSKSYQCGST